MTSTKADISFRPSKGHRFPLLTLQRPKLALSLRLSHTASRQDRALQQCCRARILHKSPSAESDKSLAQACVTRVLSRRQSSWVSRYGDQRIKHQENQRYRPYHYPARPRRGQSDCSRHRLVRPNEWVNLRKMLCFQAIELI